MKKRVLAFFLIISLFFAAAPPASAFQCGFNVSAEGVLLVSLDTGETLYSKNADKKLYPASLTKIMTALIALEQTADLDSEKLTVSREAIRSLDGTDSSVGGLKEGEELTMRQALYYLLMSSANEVANAIAEHISGGVAPFVEKMNVRAAELSMNGTHYMNAHGLHDPDHYTTVNDMCVLVKKALENETFKEITSTTRYKMPATNKQGERTLVTTNYLQDRNNAAGFSYYYEYASGVKTGYTDEAGRCLVSTASKGGYNYLCILMKSAVRDASGALVRYEFGDSKKLYEWAFENFEYKTVIDGNTPVAEAKINLCWDDDHVPLLLEGGLSAILPKEADSSTVQIKANKSAEEFDAPIKKGQIMGTADIIYAGEKLGTLNLVAAEPRDANIVLQGMQYLKIAVSSTVFKAIVIALVCLVLIFFLSVLYLNRRRRKRKRLRRGYKGYKKHE